MKRQWLLWLFVLLAPSLSIAATYSLPAAAGTAPFAGCTASGGTVNCVGDVTISNNNQIVLTQNVTLVLGGNLSIGNSFIANNPFAYTFTIQAGGNITVGNNTVSNANFTAGANITYGNGANISGNITAGAAIIFGSNPTVNGNCSGSNPSTYNPVCGPVTLPITGTCEQFNTGLPSKWTVSGSGEAGTSNATAQSATDSLYLRNQAVSVTTPAYDLSSETSVTFSAWIRRGDDSFSENPDGGEDLQLQYRNNANNWVTLTTYVGNDTPGEVFSPTVTLTGTQLHSNFAIRFEKIGGNNGDFDYWHVDDVCFTPDINLPAPVLEYQFDELKWEGSADEVIDSSGNSKHAVADFASNTTTTADGKICRAASFNGVDQLITSNHLAVLNGSASLSFWIKTSDAGSGAHWKWPGVTGIEVPWVGNETFWGIISPTGKIGIAVGPDLNQSTVTINTGTYQHVVLTRDAITEQLQIFVNGTEVSTNKNVVSTTYGDFSSNNAREFTAIGRVINSAFLDGLIDEFIIFDEVLNQDQVNTIYTLQDAGKNLDGSTRTCSLPLNPLAWFSLDEINSGQYADDSGNGFGVDTVGTAIAVDASKGKICSANEVGNNNNQAAIDGLRTDINLSTDVGEKGAISFWFKSKNNWNAQGRSRILFDASSANDFFTLQLDQNGRLNLFFEDTTNSDDFQFQTSALGFTANTWHHVTATWDMQNQIVNFYVDGSLEPSSQITGGGFSNWSAFNNLPSLNVLLFGDGRNSNSYGGVNQSANGTFDEIYIFNKLLTANEAKTVSEQTHPCPIFPLAYYQFEDPSWTGSNGEVKDETANALSLTNSTDATISSGRVCTSAFFNGAQGNLQRANNAALDNYSDGVSASFWMNRIATPANGGSVIVEKSGIFAVRLLTTGQFRLDYVNALNVTQTLTTSGLNLSTNSWYHVAVAVGPVSQKIWVDGVLVLNSAATTTLKGTSTGDFQISTNGNSANSTTFPGRIDELRLYNKPITQLEVNRDLAATHSCDTSLVGWYQFEEVAYSGATGELIDYSGNRNNGLSLGASARATGYQCYGATITRNTDIAIQEGIETGVDINNDIGDQGTLMLWYASDRNWNQGGRKNLMDASTNYAGSANDKFFYLEIASSGQLRFAFEDAVDDDDFAVVEPTGTVRQAGDWHHIAITWDYSTVLNTPANNTNYKIFVDGVLMSDRVLRENGGSEGPNINGMPNLQRIHLGDNASGYSVPSGTSASGTIDEFRAYSRRLTAAEILAISAETHPCAGEAIVRYRFEEPSWSGVPDEVIDDSGYSKDAIQIGSVNPKPYTSTCRAAYFDSDVPTAATINAIATPMDVDRDIGNSGSVMMWLKTNQAWGSTSVEHNIMDASRNPRDFYASLLTNGAIRFVVTDAASNKFTLTSATKAFTADTWVHVAFTWNFASQRLALYINGALETSQTMSGNFNIADLPTLYLGDSQNNRVTGSAFSWSGWMEDARIFNYERSAAEVLTSYNAFTPCVEVLDHFDIDEFDNPTVNAVVGSAINCQAERIKVTARQADNTEAITFVGKINLTTSTGRGTWTWAGPAGNNLVDSGLDNGSATIDVLTGNAGVLDNLFLSHTQPGNVSIKVQYGFLDETSGAADAGDDPLINYSPSGLIVATTATGNATANIDVIAGDASQDIYLKAITTDPTTGVCTSLFSGSVAIEMQTTCVNPSSCIAGQGVTFTNNASNNPVTNTWQSITTNFGANSRALFRVNVDDVGIHRHDFRYKLSGAASPANETLAASVNYYARPKRIEIVSRNSHANTSDANARELDPDLVPKNTIVAQTDFYVDIRAVNTAGNTYPSFNRIDFNTATPATVDHRPIAWSHSVYAPATGDPGALSGGSVLTVDGTYLQTTLNFNEIEEINLSGQLSDFWNGMGTGVNWDYPLSAVKVGKFIPSYLTVNDASTAIDWNTPTSTPYQGMTTSITGLSYQVEAYGRLNNRKIANYDNTNPVFASPILNSLSKLPANTNLGGTLTSTLNWTVADTADDDRVDITGTLSNVLWQKKDTPPTNADIATNGTANVTGFALPLSTFTDTAGNCVKTTSTEPTCSASNQAINLSTAQSLLYARLRLPAQTIASANIAFVPVTLEYLTGIDASGEAIFSTQTSENLMDASIISGLKYDGELCTLTTCPATNSTLAPVTLTGVGGFGSVLSAGQGILQYAPATTLQGIQTAQALIPNWLTWYWNGDINGNNTLDLTERSASSSMLLFGDYQGQAPLLFTRPGFR